MVENKHPRTHQKLCCFDSVRWWGTRTHLFWWVEWELPRWVPSVPSTSSFLVASCIDGCLLFSCYRTRSVLSQIYILSGKSRPIFESKDLCSLIFVTKGMQLKWPVCFQEGNATPTSENFSIIWRISSLPAVLNGYNVDLEN